MVLVNRAIEQSQADELGKRTITISSRGDPTIFREVGILCKSQNFARLLDRLQAFNRLVLQELQVFS